MRTRLFWIFTLLPAFAGISFLVQRSPAPSITENSPARLQEYHNPTALVSASQARAMIDDGIDIVFIDVRPLTDYLATGHIKDALQIWRPDMEADKGEHSFGGMRASREKMSQLLSRLGIRPDTTIIPYDARGNYDASRFWWLLSIYGHTNLHLMNGGLQGWTAAGFATSRASPQPRKPTHYQFPASQDLSSLAHLDDMKIAMSEPGTVILDTRSIAEFNGEKIVKGAFRSGHIPGAIRLEHTQSLNRDNTFKNAEELREVFRNVGITEKTAVIAYCQSGVRSAHTRFVMAELLGYRNIKNYDGSWIEWSWHSSLPALKGS